MLQDRMPCRCYGLGGPRSQDAGLKPIADWNRTRQGGLREVIGSLIDQAKLLLEAKQAIRKMKPDVLIVLDAPDFNLRLLKLLGKQRPPTYYFIAPQAWAWRPSRAKLLPTLTDRVGCIFPFEETWFRARGVAAEYVGHPYRKKLKERLKKDGDTKHQEIRLAIFPGSRDYEIRQHLHLFLDALKILQEEEPLIRATLCLAEESHERFLQDVENPPPSMEILVGEAWSLLRSSDIAIAAAGSITVQAAFACCPVVVAHRVHATTYSLLRKWVRLSHVAMPNIICRRPGIPELLQDRATPRRIATQVLATLRDPQADLYWEQFYEQFRCKVGDRDAASTVASSVMELMEI